jgi:thymidylate synthase
MVVVLRKPSVASAFEELIPKILIEGEEVYTEFGERTKELRNVVVEITNPKLKRISDRYPLGKMAVETYTNHLLYGVKGDSKFSYDYHSRICEFPCEVKVNQLEYILGKLRRNKNSRRAVAVVWHPKIDGIEKVDDDRASCPCLQYIQFLVRDGGLEMTVLFRSNDAFVAFHSNALGLIALGERVARELGLELRKYVHHAVSMHVYVDRDETELRGYFPELTKYLGKNK